MFALVVAAIAVLAVISYRFSEDVVRADSKVNQAHRVIEIADELAFSYKDARFAVNSIIIRRDNSRYDAYASYMKQLKIHMDELRQLTSDNPTQQVNIDSLDGRLDRFRTVSDSLIKMVTGKLSADQILDVFSNSETIRDDVTSHIDKIKAAQMVMLAQREEESKDRIVAFKRVFLSLLVGIGILLLCTFLVIRYNFNKRIRAQQEMRRANLLFEKIFYESPIAIIITDLKSGEILNCNQQFADTLNFDMKELIGKTAAELGIFQNQQKRDEMIAGARKDGTFRRTEVYIKPRNREPIYVSIQAHIISLYDRECLLTAIMDLTTHKRAEDEIRKALATERELNRFKSNFVTLASHEFKTPLTAILSSAFLLEKYSYGENEAKAAKHVARIKSTVKSLVSILDEFLSVSKIEEGHVES